jgi:starch phosphorylase
LIPPKVALVWAIRGALDLLCSGHFSRHEPGIFAPIRENLLERGDDNMHLADLSSYGVPCPVR